MKKTLTTLKKRNFQPINSDVKPLHVRDIAEALCEVAPNCIVHTAIAKEEIDFVINGTTIR